MAGLFARPTLAEVGEACAPYLEGGDVLAYVMGRSAFGDRLLYVVTAGEVAVVKLRRGLAEQLNPKELVASWPRGEVEVEGGISSVRFGPHRAKVRFSQRHQAAEVAQLAGLPPG